MWLDSLNEHPILDDYISSTMSSWRNDNVFHFSDDFAGNHIGNGEEGRSPTLSPIARRLNLESADPGNLEREVSE